MPAVLVHSLLTPDRDSRNAIPVRLSSQLQPRQILLALLLLAFTCLAAAAPQRLPDVAPKEVQVPKVPTTKEQIEAQIHSAIKRGDAAAWRRLSEQLLPLLKGEENESERAEVLQVLGYLIYLEGQEFEAEPYLDEAVPLLKRYFSAEPNQAVQSLALLAIIRSEKGDVAGARAFLEDAKKLVPNDADLTYGNKSLLGEAHVRLGDTERGEAFLNGAQLYYEAAKDEVSRGELARVTYWLAFSRFNHKDFRTARPLAERSLDLLEKITPPSRRWIAASEQLLGVIHLKEGRYKEAEPLLAHSVPEFARAPANPVQERVSRHSLGLAQRGQGKFAEAKVQFEEQLRIDEARYGKESPYVADDLDALGDVLGKLQQWRASADMFERVLSFESAREPASARHAATSLRLAHALWNARLFCPAETQFRETLRLAQLVNNASQVKYAKDSLAQLAKETACRRGLQPLESLPANEYLYIAAPLDGDLLELLNGGLKAFLADSRPEDAERNFREAIKLAEARKDLRARAYALARLAEVLMFKNQHTEAVSAARQALEVSIPLYPPKSAPILDRRRTLAIALFERVLLGREESETLDEARNEALRAKDLLAPNEHHIGPQELARHQKTLGSTLIAVGERTVGRSLVQSALDHYHQERPSDPAAIGECEYWLGRADYEDGLYSGAERQARHALALWKKPPPGDLDSNLRALLGSALWKQGRPKEALPEMRTAMTAWSKAVPGSTSYARSALSLAEICLDLKDWNNTFLYADRAFKAGGDVLDAPRLARAAFLAGFSQLQMKQPAKAEPLFKTSFALYQSANDRTGQGVIVGGYLHEAEMATGEYCGAQKTLQTVISLSEAQMKEKQDEVVGELKRRLAAARAKHPCAASR